MPGRLDINHMTKSLIEVTIGNFSVETGGISPQTITTFACDPSYLGIDVIGI